VAFRNIREPIKTDERWFQMSLQIQDKSFIALCEDCLDAGEFVEATKIVYSTDMARFNCDRHAERAEALPVRPGMLGYLHVRRLGRANGSLN
jgi:hypothetical protein